MRKRILLGPLLLGLLWSVLVVNAHEWWREIWADSKWVDDTHYDLIVDVKEEDEESKEKDEDEDEDEDDLNLDMVEWDDKVNGIKSSENLSYHAQISDYVGRDETVVIPFRVDGARVAHITKGAFAGNEYLKEVIIQGNLESMDSQKYLEGETVVCEKGAFEDCINLERVVFQNGMVSSSYEDVVLTFAGCNSLETFVVENPDKVAGIMSIDGVLYGARNGVPVTLLAYPAAKKDTTYTLPATVNLIPSYPTYVDVFCGNPYLEEIKLESNDHFTVEDGVLYTADKSRIAACLASKNDGTLGIPETVAHSQETMEEHAQHRADTGNKPVENADNEAEKGADVKSETVTDISAGGNVENGPREEKQSFFEAAKENIVWILLGVVLEMIHIRIKNKKLEKLLKKGTRS